MAILSTGWVIRMAILNGKWTTVSKIWYLGKTDVTIYLMLMGYFVDKLNQQ